jgi:glucose-6-phosphate dehydrogenase assembly protein OpcA
VTGTVSPEHILKELTNLWVSLGKPGDTETAAGVLRACTMTLIVIAEESEDVGALGETIAALMPEHPARSIMLRLRGAGEATLSERVYAQCWLPFGQRRQICCEQIEIIATDAALDDLVPVVLPLAAPDLPVIIWLRSARLWDVPAFQHITAQANKVVMDSTALTRPASVLRSLAEASKRGMIIGDLAWARLTRWREMVSLFFDNRDFLARLDTVSQVRAEFTPQTETSARYLTAWTRSALPQTAQIELTPGQDLSLELSGPALHLRLSRDGDQLKLTVDGQSRSSTLPASGDYQPLREELGLVRHDRVFERTLALAASLEPARQ